MFALSALVGFCGTPWRGPFPPKPQPDPWWLVKSAGVFGGVLGGWAMNKTYGGAQSDLATSVVLTSVGAFLGARLAEDALSLIQSQQSQRTAGL